jgi:hypothetical protein
MRCNGSLARWILFHEKQCREAYHWSLGQEVPAPWDGFETVARLQESFQHVEICVRRFRNIVQDKSHGANIIRRDCVGVRASHTAQIVQHARFDRVQRPQKHISRFNSFLCVAYRALRSAQGTRLTGKLVDEETTLCVYTCRHMLP